MLGDECRATLKWGVASSGQTPGSFLQIRCRRRRRPRGRPVLQRVIATHAGGTDLAALGDRRARLFRFSLKRHRQDIAGR